MATGKMVAAIIGGNFVGKGIQRGLRMIDTSLLGAAEPTTPITRKPSTWIGLITGIGSAAFGVMRATKAGERFDAGDAFLMSMGGQLTSNVFDVVEHVATGGALVSRGAIILQPSLRVLQPAGAAVTIAGGMGAVAI